MGRLEHLRASLGTWLRHTPWPVLVADYACPDRTADWVGRLGHPRVRALRVSGDELTYSRPVFNKPAALNALFDAIDGEERLVLLDADTLVYSSRFVADVEALGPHQMLLASPEPSARDLTGMLSAMATHLRLTRADTGMVGWGAEDLDLRARIYLDHDLEVVELPTGSLGSIAHDDALRVAHYTEPDKESSARRNLERTINMLAARGVTLAEMAKPPLSRLLGLRLQ
jgi:hypothetical protein